MIQRAAVAWLMVAATSTLDAQARSSAVERFVAQAQLGTRRYQSQATAIADGFKRVGVEFPAMGEHWVNLQRVMEDTLAPSRPSVLIYVNAGGKPRLAGVGYTALLEPGEKPPDFAPARGFWHEHNGTVADESFPLAHHLGGASAADPSSLRLSILHAWVWTPNDAGVFATDNWGLPALRVGATAPLALSRDALRGLALASDTTDYYALMIRTGLAGRGGLSAAEERAVLANLAEHRARAMRAVSRVRGDSRVPDDVGVSLASVWASLWSALEQALPARRSQLRQLRQHL